MFDAKKIMKWEPGEPPSFPVTPIEKAKLKNGILVRGSNWLGDAVMTFPALKQLRSILPESCGLFVATPKGLAPIYRAMPTVVNDVVELKNAHAFPDKNERGALRQLHAGAGMLFNNSFRDALALCFTGIHCLYGAKARNRSLLLKNSWAFEKRKDHELNYPHQATKYLAMTYALGASKWDGILPELHPNADLSSRKDDLASVLRSKHVLAIAPGAAYGDGKRWQAPYFQKVASWWLNQYPDSFIIALGSKAERPGAEEALAGLPQKCVRDLAGETNLDELMIVLKSVSACVANDSGIMHLSAALGGSGIAVFGSTDPAATAPLSLKWTMLYDKLPCSPCFKRVCPLGTKACMDRISPEDVIEILKNF